MNGRGRVGRVLGAMVLWACCSPGLAEEPAAPDCLALAEQLVEQLSSSDFVSRQAATQRLADAGPDAIPALELAIAAGNREASTRALALLKQQYLQSGAGGRQLARAALERLAASDRSSTAQRAREVLQPPVERTAMTPWGGIPVFPNNGFPGNGRLNFGPPPQMQLGGLQIGGNAAGIGAQIRRVSYSEINGRRGVELAERDRTVRMETSPAGTIRVDISERSNGRDVQRSFTARDRDDLARQDAEMAKLYDQFHRPGTAPPGLPRGFGFEHPTRLGSRPMLR